MGRVMKKRKGEEEWERWGRMGKVSKNGTGMEEWGR